MKKWVIALIVGLALLGLGAGVGVNDNTIKCGSEIMSPGDECEETRSGTTVGTKTYDEMKASNEAGQRTFNSWGRWVLLGGGLALTVLGVVGIVKERRRRANAGPTTADMHLAQQQQASSTPGQPQQYSPPPQQQQQPPQYSPGQQPAQPQQQYPPQDFDPRG